MKNLLMNLFHRIAEVLAELYRENVVFSSLVICTIETRDCGVTGGFLKHVVKKFGGQLSRPCYTDLRPTNCCLLPCQYIRQLCFDSESLKYLVFSHITEALTSCCCCDMRKVVAYPALLFVTLTN